jgi:hypothetical protein
MPEYKFRNIDNIGANDAESDTDFLNDCFVDQGILDALVSTADPKRIVLGRTGSGKTALLLQLQRKARHAIRIEPESLAMSHVSNSTILQWLDSAGVKLDIFFKLLWRHVIAIEILQKEIGAQKTSPATAWFDSIIKRIHEPTRKHLRAAEYLKTWGERFWEHTDHRIKDITTKLESQLEAKTGVTAGTIDFSAGASKTLSKEERAEIQERAQHVVNEVQIRELSDVIDLIGAVLDNSGRDYHILIDRLDEDWVEDRVRYQLVRALIETVRDFQKAQRVKIVIALRLDLLERVFRKTRQSGFQAEKYDALFLHLHWSKSDLKSILDRRVRRLIRHRYAPTADVGLDDILPTSVAGLSGSDYLLARTTGRPRDAIQFLNFCINKASGEAEISSDMLKAAEQTYSCSRLKSLHEEWSEDYPSLPIITRIFKSGKSQLRVRDIPDTLLDEIALALATAAESSDPKNIDKPLSAGARCLNNELSSSDVGKHAFWTLYHTGFLGAKVEGFESMAWSMDARREIAIDDFSETSILAVHPAYWRCLGIRPAEEFDGPNLWDNIIKSNQ